MKEVTVQIPDKKHELFIELMKSLSFVKKVKTLEEDEPTKEEILEGIRQAVKEVNLIKQGKLKGTPLKDFLNEL
ncbi:MAG: hypothetical protein ACOVMQ_11410 [Cyclobacteriaceae bacterium]|jgi:hypothetical protein